GAEWHAVVEVDDVLVEEPYAAARYGVADARRLVGAVQAEKCVLVALPEIEGARADGVLDAAFHAVCKKRHLRVPRHHLGRRKPFRPSRLVVNDGRPAPRKALTADANPVTHRLAVRFDEIEETVLGIDDDGTGWLLDRVGRRHFLSVELRV